MAVDEIAVPLAQKPSDESPLTLLMDKVSKWINDHTEFIVADNGLFGYFTQIYIWKEDILDFCQFEMIGQACIAYYLRYK